ncbi:MAG: SDR family NAD(P)-dependent oxidoreductase [Candidatus Hodarchaeales archaeon]|jgi:NAD(P)-dependent dehydrogenase (short-subunit alcohol dehydrogenase family)
MKKLDGKTAIITGISSGIGRATAILFAKNGANIVGSDIDAEGGKIVIETIEGLGGNSIFVKSDISISEEVKHLVKRAHEFKEIDILFNNAGIEVVKKLEDTLEEEWERTIDVNLKSVFLCTKYVIPEMRKNGGGVIINNSSAAALVGSFSPVYSASKGGIVSLTKSLAVELAPDNIRVNCVCPGAIETPMLQRVIEKQGDPKIVRDTRTNLYPLGRFGKPEEIAKTVLFLACDDSSFVTGGVFVVDGGFTSR